MLINSIEQAVGDTPLLRLNRFCQGVYAKLEMFNPYSVKDRAAISMLDGAGEVRAVVEATSGNTGIGLCMACAARGIPITIVMPDNATAERIKIMTLLGAEVVLTPARDGMAGANARAKAILDGTPGAFMSSQFDNPFNPAAHKATAGEILADLPDVDIFVAAVGTGGTFTGVSRALKAHNAIIRAYAVEPDSSPVLSGGAAGAHNIPGIGAGFVPKNFDRTLCDGIIRITDGDAMDASKRLARSEGVLTGISGGAALCACEGLAKKHPDKKIVTILPDSLERYLSAV